MDVDVSPISEPMRLTAALSSTSRRIISVVFVFFFMREVKQIWGAGASTILGVCGEGKRSGPGCFCLGEGGDARPASTDRTGGGHEYVAFES